MQGGVAVSALAGSGILANAGIANAASMKTMPVFGPAPGIAKLNANENPYGPSDLALKAVAQAASDGGAYYAYNAAMYLWDMIAEKHGLSKANIAISAGSSPVL